MKKFILNIKFYEWVQNPPFDKRYLEPFEEFLSTQKDCRIEKKIGGNPFLPANNDIKFEITCNKKTRSSILNFIIRNNIPYIEVEGNQIVEVEN